MIKSNKRKIIITAGIVLLALGLIVGYTVIRRRRNLLGSSVYGDFGERVNFSITADGRTSTVKGYYINSERNTYLSVRDVAGALSGSEKHFNVQRGNGDAAWEIVTGRNYVATTKKENTPFSTVYPGSYSGTNDEQGRDGLLLYSPIVNVDGERRQYLWYYKADTDGTPITSDAYVSLMDFGLILGLKLEFTSETGITIPMDEAFSIDPDKLDEAEYFHDLNGVVLANMTTGEILYSYDSALPNEIASTSKLMTWLIVQEAIDDGRLSPDDTWKISERVMRLANSSYGLEICRLNWSVGKEVTIRDLIAAMLLPSSNEAALALAEAVSSAYGEKDDPEARFVRRMNDRAYELGLTTAMFYNASGLPYYEEGQIKAKLANRMSAADLYLLAAYIMRHYKAEFTAFSAENAIKLDSFGENVYAVSSYHDYLEAYLVTGMKTGTTDRAGCCMVASMDIRVKGEEQTVIAVVLGAENRKLRIEQTSVLLAYARQYYRR